jgi:hypothetical protein
MARASPSFDEPRERVPTSSCLDVQTDVRPEPRWTARGGASGRCHPHEQPRLTEPKTVRIAAGFCVGLSRVCSPSRSVPRCSSTKNKAQDVQDRIADRITAFSASMTFVYIHILWFGLWIGLGVEKHPFGLLTMIVSLEAALSSTWWSYWSTRTAGRPERSGLSWRPAESWRWSRSATTAETRSISSRSRITRGAGTHGRLWRSCAHRQLSRR